MQLSDGKANRNVIGDIHRHLPYMSAMSPPYSARFSVAPMMDWPEN
jgi:hypothetical protein